MREIRTSGSVRGASGNGRPYRERYLAVGAYPDEWPEVHRTRPVPFATREARFGVANRRPLPELNRSRLRFTFVIKGASEPAPRRQPLRVAYHLTQRLIGFDRPPRCSGR